MKEKLRQVLRVFRVDVLLFALYVKIALAVTKKLTALKNAVQRFLTRLFPRNGKKAKACATCTAVDPAATVTANAVVDRTTNTAMAAVTNAPLTATATATATATVTIVTP